MVEELESVTTNDRQALQMRRYQMAAGTSVMVIVLIYVAYLFEGLEWVGLVRGAAMILLWIACSTLRSARASTCASAIRASRCRS